MRNLQIGVMLLIVAMGVAGCFNGAKQSPIPLNNTVSADSFRLRRTTKIQLSQGRTLIDISEQTPYMYIYPYGVEFMDGIEQPGGYNILFYCDNVADKILDRNLVPEVEKQCKIAHEDALYFWTKTPPSEFTDEHGKVWKREN